MAIESLGSLMTVQAQTYPQVRQEQNSNNVQTQLNVIQPQITEKKLTTVIETNKSELGNEFNKENNKNFKTKNKKILDDKNVKQLSEEEKESLKEVIKEANRIFGNTRASFSFHEGANRIEIKIIDKETNEVIREIPPEEALDSIAKRMEMYEKCGLLFDKKC